MPENAEKPKKDMTNKPKDKKSSKNPSNKALSEEDRALWEAHVQDMDKSADDKENEDFEALLEGQEVKAPSEPTPLPTKDKAPEQKPAVKERSKKHQNKQLPQLDKRTAEKLRKGQFPIEARIDLHGLNKTQAHEKLMRFISSCYAQEFRCALVITGKGISKSTSEDWLVPSKGVLKENVPYWLSGVPLKDIVLKAMPAQPKDGGGGALYVYLKQKR